MLYCAAVEHFVQVAVIVRRGASHADRSILCVREMLVCTQCQSFVVSSNEAFCENG